MEDNYLVLSNFSSVFEILVGYYLFIGFSDKFNDWFGIGNTLNPSIVNFGKSLSETINDLKIAIEKESFNRIKLSESIEEVKIELAKSKIKSNDIDTVHKEFLDVEKRVVRIRRLYKLHFPDCSHQDINDNVSLNHSFLQTIRPFYVYFGILSLSMLIMCGVVEGMKKYANLNAINVTTSFMTICLFILVFSKLKFRESQIIKPFTSFLFSIAIFIILITATNGFFLKLAFIPWWLQNSISYNDLQIIVSVILIFSPLLLHFMSLLVLYYYNTIESKLINKRIEKISNRLVNLTITKLELDSNVNTNIPKL